MNLLDRAVKLAAEQDEPLEMNFVRKHAQQQAEELGVSLREAATRVFSNSSGGSWRGGVGRWAGGSWQSTRSRSHMLAPPRPPRPPSTPPGSYSSNVNLAVENSSWSDEQQLQEMYLSRKSFAFNSDRPGAGGEASREVFASAMKTVDVTFQNLDSSEISLTGGCRVGVGGCSVGGWVGVQGEGGGHHRARAHTHPPPPPPHPPTCPADVSHYFDSDPTKLVAGLRGDGKSPAAYIADTTTANAQVRARVSCVRGCARRACVRACSRPNLRPRMYTHPAPRPHTLPTPTPLTGALPVRDCAPGRAHQAAQPQVVRGDAVVWVRGRARDPKAPHQHHGLVGHLGHGGQLGVQRGQWEWE